MVPRLAASRGFSAWIEWIALLCVFALTVGFPAVALATSAPVSSSVSPFLDANDARVPAAVAELRKLSPQATVLSSGDYRVGSLVSGYALSLATTHTITYSFYKDDVWHGTYYGTETGVHEVSEGVKANVRSILAWYSTLINVDFVEVAETTATVGNVRIMDSAGDGTGFYAYCYYPYTNNPFYESSDVHLNPDYDFLDPNDTNGFQNAPGSHGYMSLAHELGHGMGLKHSFEGTPALPNAEDDTANTIMSYSFTGNAAATPMAYDVAALQYLYGTRTKNSGNDTYAFTSQGTSQYTVGGQTVQSAGGLTKQCIHDSAGYDTIDASALPTLAAGYKLDLNGGGWLIAKSDETTDADGKHYFEQGSSLAFGFDPEKIVNSGSDDLIIANSSANTFAGYTTGRVVGNDRIEGATAADKLDLTAYASAAVSKTTSGTDLVLGMGANGSVTLAGYYSGNTPAINYRGTSANVAPVAKPAASATSGVAPMTVRFDGSGSSDTDGSIQSWAWSFSDGSTVASATATKTYAIAGSYTATLTVTDNDGAATSKATTITVVPAQGSLVGTVTSGGQVLAGATVSIAGLTATTTANGAYAIASIPASTYPVTFAKSGYTTATATVTIKHAQTTTSSASLTHEVGTLSGTVKWGTTPIGGVTVAVSGLTATTAADGTYSIGNVPKGTWPATYSKSGYATQTSSVTIATGATTTKTLYLARETGVLTGTVTVDGSPASGVSVSLPGKTAVLTNVSGAYTISAVYIGSWVATFSKSGCTTQTPTISISANQTTTVDIALAHQGGTLAGTVTCGGIPVPGVAVTIAGLTATTSPSGAYSIPSIPIGANQVVNFLKSAYKSQAAYVDIIDGQVTVRDILLVAANGSLNGTVTAGGFPLAGATISAGGTSTTSGADGAYSIPSAPAGTYSARFSKAGYVSRDVTVTVSAPQPGTASVDLARLMPKAKIVCSPARTALTYKRTKGVAKFSLSAAFAGWGGAPVAGATAYLQTSKYGVTWANTYRLRTSSVGKVSKTFKIMKRQALYYRWSIAGKPGVCLAATSAKMKITVK